MTAWQTIVRLFADGRHVCNCGDAYYNLCGEAIKGDGTKIYDHPICVGGCGPNRLTTRDEIATKLLKEALNG